ncbi:hypothetical protein IWX90DRAFT_417248 [Phyllosticta citrichinensis]|uniref:Uncharacterized protein n=1 Tax=Phyllosticta citrichinensis TaxID=1130410 RepID=A0ABR1XKD6_9PEZI
MTALRAILNETAPASSSPGSSSSAGRRTSNSSSYYSPATTYSGLPSPVMSPMSRGLERMSLDYVAPGSRPSPGPASSGYAAHEYGHHYDRSSRNYHAQYANPYPPQGANWASVNGARHRPSTAESGSGHSPTNESDYDLDGYYVRSSTASSAQSENARRDPRHAYGEEERVFIMVCAILKGMSWKEIEKQFRVRFPPGGKRRHPEPGLWNTYPDRARTAGGLTCAYYRIREQWGIEKVRGVPDDLKTDVKGVVRERVLMMGQFPDLQEMANRCC